MDLVLILDLAVQSPSCQYVQLRKSFFLNEFGNESAGSAKNEVCLLPLLNSTFAIDFVITS
jgi:hypothetical protein